MKQTDIKVNVAYRPDIDGLRCIAVMLVVLYHLFPKAIRGGFIGVDIFFVISGYLITSILYSDMQAGNYSILKFYGRRIRRIFPALIVVLAVTAAIGWFILSPDELVSLGQTMIGGATFSANLVLLHQISYFDIAAENKPLLHLWSLGVEEQFYIAWPLILYAAYKRKFNLLKLIFAIMIGSFILNIALINNRPEETFYLPFTRAWELAAGAALVLFLGSKEMPIVIRIENVVARLVWDSNRVSQPPRTLADIAAIAGIALIALAAIKINNALRYPGFFALMPVVGAALLISSKESFINKKLLSSRPLVFIGLISYPLYLWHFPLIAYVKLGSDEAPTWPSLAATAAASFLLAVLTYRFIEKPIRSRRFDRPRVIQLCAAMASLAAIGVVAVHYDGFQSRLPDRIRSYNSAKLGEETSANWRLNKCLLTPDQDETNFAPECTEVPRRPMVLLWGDSYAAALYPGMKAVQDAANFGTAELTSSACMPGIGIVHPERPHCKAINDVTARKIEALQPEIVILHSTWKYAPSLINLGLEQTVLTLRNAGIKRIVLLGPVPTWLGRSLPQNLVDYYFKDSSHQLLPERTRYRLFSGGEMDTKLKMLSERLNIEFISALDIMCNEAGCLTRMGDGPAELSAFDNGHMTLSSSIFLAREISKRLFEK